MFIDRFYVRLGKAKLKEPRRVRIGVGRIRTRRIIAGKKGMGCAVFTNTKRESNVYIVSAQSI